MPEWATFVGFTFVVTAGLLVLSYASQGVLTDSDTDSVRDASATARDSGSIDDRITREPGVAPAPDDAAHRRERSEGDIGAGIGNDTEGAIGIDADAEVAGEVDADTEVAGEVDTGAERATGTDSEAEAMVLPKSGVAYRPGPAAERDPSPTADLSTSSLLANVAVSQGLFGALLLFGAWYAEIPLWAFGIGSGVTGGRAVAIGVGLGVALYAANEVSAALGARFGLGVGDGQRLRGALAPETAGGWLLLLVVVLPIIAGFEEVLFRGALVGVVSSGYDVSAWAMAVVASGAFALGHGAQGRLGVLVTGALGFVLAAAFVLTGSLVVVIVAHYLVNALEFVVHEGFGVEWPPEEAES